MGKAIGIFFAVVLVLVGLPVGCSMYSAWVSASTAPARVVNKTLQTDNIINNYEWFYDQAASFRSRKSQVDQYKGLLASETDADEKRRLRIELSAMQQSCRDIANDYDANAEKSNRNIFKTKETPVQLDASVCD